MERYMKKKKEELAALAREAGVKGRSRMTKVQLARALADLSKAGQPGVSVPSSAAIPPEKALKTEVGAGTPTLPRFLGENRLCLLPQKPMTAFAYWELDEEPPGSIFLRVLSVKDGDEILSESVRGRSGTYYIHLPRSGMEIESELIVPGAEGFATVARSNRIRLPDDAPSEELDTLWMTRRREFEEIFRLSGGDRQPLEREGVYGPPGPGVPVSSWPLGRGKDLP